MFGFGSGFKSITERKFLLKFKKFEKVCDFSRLFHSREDSSRNLVGDAAIGSGNLCPVELHQLSDKHHARERKREGVSHAHLC